MPWLIYRQYFTCTVNYCAQSLAITNIIYSHMVYSIIIEGDTGPQKVNTSIHIHNLKSQSFRTSTWSVTVLRTLTVFIVAHHSLPATASILVTGAAAVLMFTTCLSPTFHPPDMSRRYMMMSPLAREANTRLSRWLYIWEKNYKKYCSLKWNSTHSMYYHLSIQGLIFNSYTVLYIQYCVTYR